MLPPSPKKSHQNERGSNHGFFPCAALILPWLTPQELANVSLTCKTLHQVAQSITLHRSLDASRSFENLPIPFHNTVDQYPYAYFFYTPFHIIPSSSSSSSSSSSLNRQFWGPNSSQSLVLSGSSNSEPERGYARMVDESGWECENCEKVSEDNVIGCPCMELEREEGMGIMSECGPSCSCRFECGNRLSQRGIQVKLKICEKCKKRVGC